MTPDEAVDRGFLDRLGALADQSLRSAALPVGQTTSLTGTRCLEIFGSQLASRHLDLAARVLRSEK
jgi:2-oxoisovalerate dehydrogenase E1 component